MRTFIGTRLAGMMLAAAACISLSGMPVQAAVPSVGVTAQYYRPAPSYTYGDRNWSWDHQNWMAQCAPRADRYGRWGRDRRTDNWCANNQRFRRGDPDGQWRYDHPWDSGRGPDRPWDHGNH